MSLSALNLVIVLTSNQHGITTIMKSKKIIFLLPIQGENRIAESPHNAKVGIFRTKSKFGGLFLFSAVFMLSPSVRAPGSILLMPEASCLHHPHCVLFFLHAAAQTSAAHFALCLTGKLSGVFKDDVRGFVSEEK